jgi:hypothetical protein
MRYSKLSWQEIHCGLLLSGCNDRRLSKQACSYLDHREDLLDAGATQLPSTIAMVFSRSTEELLLARSLVLSLSDLYKFLC